MLKARKFERRVERSEDRVNDSINLLMPMFHTGARQAQIRISLSNYSLFTLKT